MEQDPAKYFDLERIQALNAAMAERTRTLAQQAAQSFGHLERMFTGSEFDQIVESAPLFGTQVDRKKLESAIVELRKAAHQLETSSGTASAGKRKLNYRLATGKL